jgi:hypothetical protein
LAQLLLSLPAAETKVRAARACAGAAGSKQTSMVASTANREAIFVMAEAPVWIDSRRRATHAAS